MIVDRTSQLVEASGDATLAEVEAALGPHGLTLDVASGADLTQTVRAWIDAGAPGARDRWLDPADQILAGFDATLPDGRALSIRPAPRRAVGPDLASLAMGCGGRFLRVDRAWLRVHTRGLRRPSAPFEHPRDPRPSEAEERILAALIELAPFSRAK